MDRPQSSYRNKNLQKKTSEENRSGRRTEKIQTTTTTEKKTQTLKAERKTEACMKKNTEEEDRRRASLFLASSAFTKSTDSSIELAENEKLPHGHGTTPTEKVLTCTALRPPSRKTLDIHRNLLRPHIRPYAYVPMYARMHVSCAYRHMYLFASLDPCLRLYVDGICLSDSTSGATCRWCVPISFSKNL